MKVIGLDGRERTWNLGKYSNNKRDAVSSGHKKARELLSELFPFERVLEELTLPGENLYADFYVPSDRLMVEVQGVQHAEYNSFFFASKADFYRAQGRDRKKEQWCHINDITLIQLFDKDSIDEWREKIVSR